MNKFEISKEPINEVLRKQLIDYAYPIIGCMHYVHENLGPGLPEYCYQEALTMTLKEKGFEIMKEYKHNIVFNNHTLDSFIKMDLVVKMPKGNIIIECKSIKSIGDREQFQTFGYLRGTQFPIAILVNFGTWPKAQIERYYYKDGVIKAF